MASDTTPNLPWTLRLLLRIITFAKGSRLLLRPDMTVNRRLLKIFERSTPPSSEPKDGVSSFDIVIDPSRDLWVRVYTPVSSSEVVSNGIPVIVYYHGGGFVLGSVSSSTTDKTTRRYARECNAVVVSVSYRLAPEHRYPSQYEDGFDALKFIDGLDDDAFPVGADRSRCFIAGESAGGNLAHHVVVKSSQYAFKKVNLKGLIAVQPFFGGEDRTLSELRFCRGPILTLHISDWYWRAFLPIGANRNFPASNVFGPNGIDLSGVKFPPSLIIVGGYDPLQDRDRSYGDALIKFGKEVEMVEYPNAFHGFTAFPDVPEVPLFFLAARDFVRRHMA